MKKIPKKKLDELIALSREYWKTGNTDILQKRLSKAQSLEKVIGVWWDSILYLLDAIITGHGYCPEAENEKIYEVLRVLGWEPSDD